MMKSFSTILVLICVSTLSACSGSDKYLSIKEKYEPAPGFEFAAADYRPVTYAQLSKDPEKYDGQRVTLVVDPFFTPDHLSISNPMEREASDVATKSNLEKSAQYRKKGQHYVWPDDKSSWLARMCFSYDYDPFKLRLSGPKPLIRVWGVFSYHPEEKSTGATSQNAKSTPDEVVITGGGCKSEYWFYADTMSPAAAR